MIQHPLLIILFLLAIQIAVLRLSRLSSLKKIFDVVPYICWIYFLPMVASTLGIIDAKSPVYGYFTQWLLPLSLFLLLCTIDVKSIWRLGPLALGMFAIGSFSVMLGMVLAFALFHPIIGGQFWSGFGALTGSWTGGSANMIAVKEALSTPDEVFLPMVVIDAVLPYLWMGILMSLSTRQKAFDEKIHANTAAVDSIAKRFKHWHESFQIKWSPVGVLSVIMVGIIGSLAARWLAGFLPTVKDVVNPFTWIIIMVSLLGLGLSFTPLRKIETKGSTPIGYFCLYFVLTTIGAKANLGQMGQVLPLAAAGLVVIAVHALVLLAACRLLKAPLFLAAVSSQANLGGVASAPIVAEVYHKGLAPVGLLLAILGNIIGTYIGILTGQLCRLFV